MISLKFGDIIHKSMGTFPLRLPAGPQNYLSFQIDVIEVDIPLIIRLDFLKMEGLLVDYLSNKLKYTRINYELPLTRMDSLSWNGQRTPFSL